MVSYDEVSPGERTEDKASFARCSRVLHGFLFSSCTVVTISSENEQAPGFQSQPCYALPSDPMTMTLRLGFSNESHEDMSTWWKFFFDHGVLASVLPSGL